MILKAPFIITARLIPGIKIADCTISLEPDRKGNGKWRYYFDFDSEREYTCADLREPSSKTHGSNDTFESLYQSMFGSLLAFLGACAESVQYSTRTGRPGENADLFSDWIGEWAAQNSDDLSMVQLEIEETRDLISANN